MKRILLSVASLLALSFAATSTAKAVMSPTFPKATFAGIIGGDSADQQGRFSIKTTSTGAFTVKVNVGGQSASFHGEFDDNFHVDTTFTYRPIPFISVDVHLIMDMSPDGDRIIGTVQIDQNQSIPFTVYQVFKYTSSDPAPQAGRFTGLFTRIDGTSPAGTGVVTVSISTKGKVKLVGTLPDGSKISTGGGLSPSGVFPIFNVLYSKKGALAGFAQFHGNNVADTTVTSGGQTDSTGLVWAKVGDGEFAGHEKIALQRYTPPTAGSRVLPALDASEGAASFSLTGGGLGAAFNKGISVTTSNKVNVTDAAGNNEGLKITIGAKTGLVTGSVTLDSKRSFNLVVLQNSGTITGFFDGSAGAGDASITPAP